MNTKKIQIILLTIAFLCSTTLLIMMFVFKDIILQNVGMATGMQLTSLFGMVSVATWMLKDMIKH